MCGIAGLYSFKGALPHHLIKEMTDAIAHRGPDADGFFENENGLCHLGHRRLSIIDLRSAANQPMTSSCQRYMIVYNGEVYNFNEIKEEILSQKDINFKTTSDTEVILEAFVLWGKEFVSKLNGMFAIAIFDKQTEKLHIYRDRIGIKPLYYILNDQLFAFASELKSITTLTKHFEKFTLNKTAINFFLRLGYIPAPHSIFNEVKKFDAGSYAEVSLEGMSTTNYWNLSSNIKDTVITDESSAKSKLKDLLESSVKYRMISDVPFGVFLSGGIDSSTIASIAQHVSDTPINTFSIGFNEAKYNESQHAASIAKSLGTHHHEFIVSYKEAIDLFDSILQSYDEPFSDSSSIPTMLVSMMARKHVTMTLSGDGGDEQFLGYGAYNWAKRLDNPLLKNGRKFIKPLLSATNSNRFKRVSEMFAFSNNTELKSHIFSVEQYYFSNRELINTISSKLYEPIAFEDIKSNRSLSSVEKQAIFDLQYYLVDDLLVKVDRATMKYSLETRVPLLDHRIVEFSLNLSQDLKIKDGESKYLLKQVLFSYLPKTLFDRPKWGFGLPIRQWLNGEMRYLIDDYLSNEKLSKCDFYNIAEVNTLKERYFNGEDFLFNKIWAIIILNQWLERNTVHLKSWQAI
jgi:asparagine synthase (glutamine-hydrolysing)